MSEQRGEGPPSGWYPDPGGAPGAQRFWDGFQWTDHTAPGAPPGPVTINAPGQPVVIHTKTNGFAIASLVLGILWLYWVGSVLALIFGYIGLNKIDASGGTLGGRGLAIAGIVLGWVGVAVLAVLLIIFGAAGA